MPEVRLVGEDGKQIGVIKTSEALAYAQERDLDLVEVAPDARPPVCRVLDYSKYKYEQAQKQKAARKHQQQITIREIKFRPKIAQNDYDTKKGHVKRFLLGKDRVKVTIMFRGREVTHPERGTALLDKLAGELSEVADRRADAAAGRAQHDDDARAVQVRARRGRREGRSRRRRAEGRNGAARRRRRSPAAADGRAPAGEPAPADAAPSADDRRPRGDAATAEPAAAGGEDNGHRNGAPDVPSPAPSDAPA